MPFGFPCHHVVSMRNICAIAKWPIDKTPTPSDVLFSIPLRQNQNNRAVANKNKITFPISIPDRENLQEKKAGKRPRAKRVFVPPAIKPASAELANNSLALKTHRGQQLINRQTSEWLIYIRWGGCGGGEVRPPAARAQAALPVPPAPAQRQMQPRNAFHSEKSRIWAGTEEQHQR